MYLTDFFFLDFLQQKYHNIPPTNTVYHFKPISNDMPTVVRDAEIRQDLAAYYVRHKDEFRIGVPAATEANPVIQESQLAMLEEIATIFRKHHTNYQLVVSPLLDKLPLNTNDIQILQQVFGADHVHNYSGRNEITADYHTYYESSYYRPHIARRILREIYSAPPASPHCVTHTPPTIAHRSQGQ